MDELIQLIARTYGIVGLLILAPIIAVIFLYKDNRRIHHDHEALMVDWELRVAKVQEQRVQDAQAITNKLVEIVSEQSALSRETNIALERISGIMDQVANTLQQILLNRKG
jgi:hypothetical protein